MPRPARLDIAGIPQHVIHRGNNRQPIFFADSDRRLFLSWLTQASRASGVHVHAYVLMTNHVHLLATPLTDGAIGRMVQSLAGRYVRHVNHARGRSGTLWEGRYRAAPIDADRYFMTCSRYIEMNPVRAGLARVPADYAWSSYRRNAMGAHDEAVSEHVLYSSLGIDASARCAVYRSLFADAPDGAEIDALRSATQSGLPYGRREFVAEIELLRRR